MPYIACLLQTQNWYFCKLSKPGMKIFKFGGASIRDAVNIRNIGEIVKTFSYEKLVIVVSALGKTTNHLEEVLNAHIQGKSTDTLLDQIKKSHISICKDLFQNSNDIELQIQKLFDSALYFLDQNKSTHYDFLYDQFISLGELLSTHIVSSYFNEYGINNQLIPAKDLIKTDSSFRDAQPDYEASAKAISEISFYPITVTQGFIGANQDYATTTLGREGSDFSAAILAKILHADSLTIWKDVPGVMNADPKIYSQAEIYPELSYQDAKQLSFFGASVIHPKTIAPLEEKNIPLFVKSFLEPLASGTKISNSEKAAEKGSFCERENLILLTLGKKTETFFEADDIAKFMILASKRRFKVILQFQSALKYHCIIEDTHHEIQLYLKDTEEEFNILEFIPCKIQSVLFSKSCDAFSDVIKKDTILLSQSQFYSHHYIVAI